MRCDSILMPFLCAPEKFKKSSFQSQTKVFGGKKFSANNKEFLNKLRHDTASQVFRYIING